MKKNNQAGGTRNACRIGVGDEMGRQGSPSLKRKLAVKDTPFENYQMHTKIV